MRKVVSIIVTILALTSCSSQKSVYSHIQSELKTNKQNKIKSILVKEKSNITALIKGYKEKKEENPFKKAYWLAIFERNGLELMKYEHNYYSFNEYWSITEGKELNFDELITFEDYKKIMSTPNLLNDKTYIYNISKPFFNEEKNMSLIYKELKTSSESIPLYEIILMTKVKNKWVFSEKFTLTIGRMY